MTYFLFRIDNKKENRVNQKEKKFKKNQ